VGTVNGVIGCFRSPYCCCLTHPRQQTWIFKDHSDTVGTLNGAIGRPRSFCCCLTHPRQQTWIFKDHSDIVGTVDGAIGRPRSPCCCLTHPRNKQNTKKPFEHRGHSKWCNRVFQITLLLYSSSTRVMKRRAWSRICMSQYINALHVESGQPYLHVSRPYINTLHVGAGQPYLHEPRQYINTLHVGAGQLYRVSQGNT